MTRLPNILHNVADHTKTLWQLLEDRSVAPDIVARLNQHMLLEEQENTETLQQMNSAEPSRIIQKLLDHSYFIQQMMQDNSMSVELQRELLDHFMEEHQEWMSEFTTNGSDLKWTVGPLWPQGG